MTVLERDKPVEAGEPAPSFDLPAITRVGQISLDELRGSRPVLVSLLRGLDCAFCRRHVAALSEVDEQLRARGVDTVAVVSTPVQRARTYIRFHPTTMMMASDEARQTHRAYGLPMAEFNDTQTDWPRRVSIPDMMAVRVGPDHDLPAAMDPMSAAKLLDAKDPYEVTPEDKRVAAPGAQLVGAFLVDRGGIVRWRFIEAEEGPQGFARFPKTEEFLSAANSVAA